MKEFLMNNMEIIGVIAAFILGWVLPNPKVNQAGKKLGEKIPKKLAIELADKLDSLEQGLRGQTYLGNKSIISNEQLSEGMDKVKVDLGLEHQSEEKDLK